MVGGTALLSWPLGRYMKWAMDPDMPDAGRAGQFTQASQRIGGSAVLRPQDWKHYIVAMLLFNAVMFAVSFSILALQQVLPLNPDGMGPIEGNLIFNTAASFTSNTNLQHYSGESTLSYLSQLGALMWLQFVSAATGIAALTALARGLAGKPLGNFFMDLQRASFLVLLPVALVVASLMVLAGVPMTLQGAAQAMTLEGIVQTIARGPVAAFVAIKQLGTNGGGFFGPNSTHPFENPSFWTNALSMICIILIPMACVWMFGRIIGRMRHAAVVFAVMAVLLLAKITGAVYFEAAPTQAFSGLPIAQDVGNLEGKELRFGASSGPTWAVLTTSTSNGSVGAMHDSLNPLTGLMPMIGMWLNATFGGVGVGMINMFLYIIVGVFIAGMMVGRTPEYLGWRVEARLQRHQMPSAELGDGAEIRRAEAHEAHEIDALAARLGDATRGIDAAAIRVQQQRRHHRRMERRLALHAGVAGQDLAQVQLLFDHAQHEPGEVVLAHKLLHRHRQEQRLVDLPGAKGLAHAPGPNPTRRPQASRKRLLSGQDPRMRR
ncbi:MAG: potassium-transporting ATPase subunit KdpA [Hyphomicrobiaceae bacterium]